MRIPLIGRITNLSTSGGPTAEPNPEFPTEITQPSAHSAPPSQSFKCEKCGAAFNDEGSAAAHIQTCEGTETILEDDVAS